MLSRRTLIGASAAAAAGAGAGIALPGVAHANVPQMGDMPPSIAALRPPSDRVVPISVDERRGRTYSTGS